MPEDQIVKPPYFTNLEKVLGLIALILFGLSSLIGYSYKKEKSENVSLKEKIQTLKTSANTAKSNRTLREPVLVGPGGKVAYRTVTEASTTNASETTSTVATTDLSTEKKEVEIKKTRGFVAIYARPDLEVFALSGGLPILGPLGVTGIVVEHGLFLNPVPQVFEGFVGLYLTL